MKYKSIIILLILSPLIFNIILALLGTLFHLPNNNDASGFGYGATIILGIPFIAIIGLATSVVTRKNKKAEKHAIIGYFIPAVIVVLLIMLTFIDDIS
jgi:hypothetical protein